MSFRRTVLLISTLLLSAASVSAEGVSLPDYERVALPNGTILLLSEKHDVPLIALEAIVRGGAVTDPADMNGMASLLAGVMQQGAGERDAASFAEAIEAVGGELNASARLEEIRVSADFMSRDTELMIELVADLLRRPALEADELNKLRDRSINLIKAAKGANPGALLPAYGNAFLFGQHPYGSPVGGNESTLANITREDLLGYYERFIGGDRLIISVVGDFNREAMKSRLTAAFGDWRAATGPLPSLTNARKQTGRRVLLIDKPGATQTYFWLANIGVSVRYPTRAELDLANTVFGGRFTSMLNTELRIEAGLTYGARSILRRPSHPGSVVISSYSETSAAVDAIDMALDVLGKLHDSGVDDDMVLSAQNYIMGLFPLRLETASQIAAQLTMLEQYGLRASYINEYGAALAGANSDSIALAIAEVYPLPENLALILIGDASSIREDVSQYGPVTELSIDAPRFRP